jgi:hypothetical protein
LTEVVVKRAELNVTGELFVEEYEGKKYTKAIISSAWPAKEERKVTAEIGADSTPAFKSPDSDLPF